MAVQYIEFKSPQGREMVKTKSGGEDRPEDAAEMARLFGAGGRYEGRCFGTEDEAIAWLDEQQAAGR